MTAAGPARPFTPTPGLRLGLAVGDRPSPTIWSALEGDPTLAFPDRVRRLVAVDQQRWSRRVLLPVARLVSLVAVTLIVWFKRVAPVSMSWHGAIDGLSIRFIRRFVSPEGAELLIRHFIIETNLLELIAVNAGYDDVHRPDLRPVDLAGLADSAVIEHDVNVLALLAGLRNRPLPTRARVDTSMLAVPAIDATSPRRRWMSLDIETALYLMNIPFALFLTADEYERAVHSLALDRNLLECLATLTGLAQLRALAPEGSCLLIRTIGDVPRRLYLHCAIHEMAHEVILRAAVDPDQVTLR